MNRRAALPHPAGVGAPPRQRTPEMRVLDALCDARFAPGRRPGPPLPGLATARAKTRNPAP